MARRRINKRGKDHGLKLVDSIWHLDLSIKGVRDRRSTYTADKEAARKIRDDVAATLWKTQVAGEPQRCAWSGAALQWIAQQEAQGTRTVEDMRDKLRWLEPHLGELYLDEINEAKVSEVLGAKRTEGKLIPARRGEEPRRAPVCASTLNRYYAVISGVFHFAIRKGWATHCPRFVEKVSERVGRKRTVLWLQHEEWERLRAELPPHLRQMARFAVTTGLRSHNVTHLDWSCVDLAHDRVWIQADNAKAGEAIAVPLNSQARAVLLEQQQEPAAKGKWVFTYKGKAVNNPNGAAFQKAKRRAGVDPRFRWHDLRHTWASWHAMNGTPPAELMKLGGWHSLEMVLVYMHLADTHVASFAENGAQAPKLRQESVNQALAPTPISGQFATSI